MNSNKLTPEKLAELLAVARSKRDLTVSSEPNIEELNTLVSNTSSNDLQTQDRHGNLIQYNEQQLQYVQLASSGKSCVCIGAAGTGKTTSTRGSMQALIQSGRVGILKAEGHKYLRDDTPGIVIVSYTRRAVANIRKNMPDDLKSNCLTIHALLEYEPHYYTVTDPETGDEKSVMKFEPSRHALNPLPYSIRALVIEEASMVSVELFEEILNALPHDCQFIFLGDIQQLPPVFGSAILGYKMLELPTIELTTVYRQALESPIIRLAHRILSGKPIKATEYNDWKTEGKLTIHPWKKKLHPDIAVLTLAKFLTTAIDSGLYNPDEDMVLIPFNKSCGTIELNRHIAQHLSRKRGAIVHEIIAGFNKHYYSIGDKVLYDKEDAVITDIKINGAYNGAAFQPASEDLDYWGYTTRSSDSHETRSESENSGNDDIDFLLSQSISVSGDSEDRVRQASHIVKVKMLDTDTVVELSTASALNNLLMSYALTVHKAQGSEFRKVFLLLHQSHATMLQRELLYTATTRAKEELYIICEPESFTNGISSQRIKGNTLAEKAEYFKGKMESRKERS